MGFIRKLTGSDAAKKAGRVQVTAGNKAIDVLREQIGVTRERLEPFSGITNPLTGQLIEAGQAPGQAVQDVDNLRQFDPTNVVDNPLFKTLADNVQQRLFASQAAKGKFGSGETGVRLGEALLPIGMGIVDRERENLSNVATLQGRSEADAFSRLQQALATTEDTTNSEFQRELRSLLAETGLTQEVANVTLDQGNAQAAGLIGSAAATSAFAGDLIKAGAGVFSGRPRA
jgi:hypothetical protein